ncbi:Phosphomevalonate kinase [Trichoderma citrinoviride]|uniref:Phosphomevalonate kinase n=1 Tax=Trichoderma citrinoviride TaxID=58853 RepID=A0A2T4BMV6_9HYPO|nr:Phosphomevalonate kinase [Trichoderma citrinoviride]PTB70654.1 Phosphomevalonate kinase [Trichoderma citrinoviride]
MPTANASVAVSAPGKVLLAGGYLVLDRAYTGLVLGLSARINVVAGEIQSAAEGVELREIVVDSPQFLDAQWRYGYHLAPEKGGIKVTQLQVGPTISANPFVETTLSYALTYIDALVSSTRSHSVIKSSRLIILADNDYYSHSHASSSGRFAKFPVTLQGANKTGLGSSAALVTSLTASLLTHYLPSTVFDLSSKQGKKTLHNLAQAAHCAAQGKVGSGFDVAAAVYGSCTYRRFSPSILNVLPEPGAPGFSDKLLAVVDGEQWDVEVQDDGVSLPPGVVLRMCDVDCGSQTVGMVKVLSWRAQDEQHSTALWNDLQARNEALAAALKAGAADQLPDKLRQVRERQMGRESDVPIEPDSQMELLDAISALDGVYGGVVPGAGGYDALALLMRDDDETLARVQDFLAAWSREKDAKVKLLGVRGEMEGVRQESLDVYDGWL